MRPRWLSRNCGCSWRSSSSGCLPCRRIPWWSPWWPRPSRSSESMGSVRSGVAVHDPLDPSVHHGRVYAAVKRQIRRDFGHTFLRGTVVENLRIGVHTVGEQDLVGAEADGVQQSGEDVADLRTAIALEGVGGAFRTGRIVEFPGFGAFRSAYDRIFGGVRREVDARLVLFGIGELLGWGCRSKTSAGRRPSPCCRRRPQRHSRACTRCGR